MFLALSAGLGVRCPEARRYRLEPPASSAAEYAPGCDIYRQVRRWLAQLSQRRDRRTGPTGCRGTHDSRFGGHRRRMDVLVVGGHGKIAPRLLRLLSAANMHAG